MKLEGGLNKQQLKELRKAMNAVDLAPKQRQRLLWRIASKGVIPAAKRNQRNQRSPDGQSWAKRKRDSKKKMLPQLPKLLQVHEIPSREAVRIFLRGGHYHNGGHPVPAGLIGAVHQRGHKRTVNADQLPPRPDQKGKLATLGQAKSLRKLGYKVRRGSRWVKPSSSEITDNMSRAQAGVIIKKLRGKPDKRTWTVELPSRIFLGVSDSEFNQMLARQLQGIGFGWDVKAQDIKGKQS